MSDRVFYCPGCRYQYSDSRLPPHGELFDCPRCHLLFLPADKDFAGGVGPRAHESAWADEGTGRKNPRPPYSRPTQHRRRKLKLHDLIVVWVTGVVMLGIAFVFYVSVDYRKQRNQQISTAIAPRANTGDTRAQAEGTVKSDENRPAVAPAEPAPPAAHTPGSLKTLQLDEGTILGEWQSPETPLMGVVGGEVFSMTFQPRGVLSVQARTVLEIATLNGGWKLSDSRLTLRLGGQEIPVTADLKDADTLRLSVGGKAAEFKRKKS
jgi:hypothetical protein